MRIAVSIGVALAVLAAPAVQAQSNTRVKSYTKKDGTYVFSHRRTTPDSSRMNNWSTKGNINPYTGKRGTVDPYKTPRSKSRGW